MERILIVDDEKEIRDLVEIYLKSEGYDTVKCNDGEEALKVIDEEEIDLVILDVMMPTVDGFTLCRYIRDEVDCPIIFITAKTMEEDILEGFSIGADDYIKKPFSILELRARVEAHLRREHREKQQVLSINELKFNLKSKEIYFNDEKILLTKGEYKICEYLARHKGQVFTLEQIFIEVYGFDKDSDSSCIREHIKNIRAKLTKYIESPITTVWGIGYKWI